MTAEFLTALLKLNLAAGLAILFVVALRAPAGRVFGARVRYALWLLVPVAMAGAFWPARRLAAVVSLGRPMPTSVTPQPIVEGFVVALPPSMPAPHPIDWAPILAGLWLAGVCVAIVILLMRQRAFVISARAGQAGPAVIGVVAPRIHLPADFAAAFSPDEQAMILAHERAHLARQDARINGLVAVFQCLNWFNPLVHLAAALARQDQEMACDEAVLATRAAGRRTYARAMLKTQIAALPLPLGCAWPAPANRALEERIGMLKRPAPALRRRLVGLAAVAAVSLTAGLAAWAAQPPVIVAAPATQGAPSTIPIAYQVQPPAQATPAAPPASAPQSTAPGIFPRDGWEKSPTISCLVGRDGTVRDCQVTDPGVRAGCAPAEPNCARIELPVAAGADSRPQTRDGVFAAASQTRPAEPGPTLAVNITCYVDAAGVARSCQILAAGQTPGPGTQVIPMEVPASAVPGAGPFTGLAPPIIDYMMKNAPAGARVLQTRPGVYTLVEGVPFEINPPQTGYDPAVRDYLLRYYAEPANSAAGRLTFTDAQIRQISACIDGGGTPRPPSASGTPSSFSCTFSAAPAP